MTTPTRSSILGPALVAAVFFSLLTIHLVRLHDWNISGLMMLPQDGNCYQRLGAPPGTVVFTEEGYDGHLFYYVARDLGMKNPCTGAYRYQRILFPILIWLFSLGDPELMPLAMAVINILAIGAGTWIMSLWLARLGKNPWLGLFYGLSLAHVLIVQYSLAGALAATLALAGAFALMEQKSPPLAALWFALALLTRETPVMLLGPLVLWTLLQRNWRAALWLCLPVLVYLGWQVFLLERFSTFELTGTNAEALTWDLAGLRHFFASMVLDQGLRTAFRTTSSIPYLVFVLAAGAVATAAFLRDRGPWALATGLQAWGSLFLGVGMWIFISSVGRITITLVPTTILLAAEKKGWAGRILLALLGGLFLLGLIRIQLAGVHEFFIQPPG